MHETRKAHVGKTHDEKREYAKNTIAPQRHRSTTDTDEFALDTNATDKPLLPPQEPLGARLSSRPKSAWGTFTQGINDHWPKILVGFISVVMLGALGWDLVLTIGLNREVGEVKGMNIGEKFVAVDTQISNSEDRCDKAIDRTNNRIDKLDARIDNLATRP